MAWQRPASVYRRDWSPRQWAQMGVVLAEGQTTRSGVTRSSAIASSGPSDPTTTQLVQVFYVSLRVGLFSTQFTIHEAGCAGLAILSIFVIVCCYSGVLRKHCFESKEAISTYPDMGETVFGRIGCLIIYCRNGGKKVLSKFILESPE